MSLQFKYRVPTWRNLWGTAFCVGSAAGMMIVASSNYKGLRLFHLFMLSPEKASMFYWACAAVFALATVMFVVLTIRSLGSPVVVGFWETHLIVPRNSMRGGLLSISYSTIKQISAQTIQHQQVITIDSTIGQGRVLSIGFKSPDEFMVFKETLASRVSSK